VLCCAVLCCAVLCCAVLCCAVLCCAVLRCAALCNDVATMFSVQSLLDAPDTNYANALTASPHNTNNANPPPTPPHTHTHAHTHDTHQADTPTPEAVIERHLPAKARHLESIHVANWLHKPQRFRVGIERVVAAAATRLEGSEHIDVPAGADRQYNLAFYSYTQVCVCVLVCVWIRGGWVGWVIYLRLLKSAGLHHPKL